ncbi:MAG: SLATT domain-containing protein [Pseudomonadales bacterium]|nr:SLATT domain-containing protein [Pseudomonadales bacterium]
MALSDSIWWTRKSKIQAEKRLLANAFQAQVILLWYSFAAVAASVYYLKFSATNNGSAGIAWVVYSVLVLCMSGFINGLSFRQRSGLIKECYETLINVYHRAKQTEITGPLTPDLEKISAEYEQILSVCENHLTIDYYMALCETYLTQSASNDKQGGLDRTPTKFIWINVFYEFSKRILMLLAFYMLPIVLFFILEKPLCL